MSKKSDAPEGQADDVRDESETKPDTKNISYEAHRKLLDEKKRLSKEFEDLKGRLDAIEQEKLEQQGDLKKTVESLKTKLKEKDDKLASSIKKFSDKSVRGDFNSLARELGCVDTELAFKAVDLTDVELGEDFSLDVEAVKSKLETLKKDKPFLFNHDVNAPRDLGPGNKKKSGKSIGEMTQEELLNELKKVM